MWNLFELAVNLFQAVMMLLFIKSRLHIIRHCWYADVLFVMLVTGFFSSYNFAKLPISDLVVFGIPLVYALLMADEKWYLSVFWSLMLGLIFASGTSLTLHIFMCIPETGYHVIMKNTFSRIVFVLATNVVLALFLFSVSRMKVGASAPTWPALLLLVAMNMTLFVVEEAIYTLQMELVKTYGEINNIPFFIAYVGVLLCIAFSILLFHKIAQDAERENHYKLEVSTMAHSQQHLCELKRMYADLQTQRHDFKQHCQVLEEMIALGGNEKAASYLKEYKEQQADQAIFLTGCIAVDALLTAKSLTMRKHGLTFTYTAYPLTELPVSEVDFCSIVGNLLDNAIEGTLRIKDFKSIVPIHLTFSRSWDMFYIFCTNSCDPNTIHKKKNGWLSSKEKEGLSGTHAIGIRNITKIAQTAEGRCSFSVESNIFHAKVVLPYPMQKGE